MNKLTLSLLACLVSAPAIAADALPMCTFNYPNGNKVTYSFVELKDGDAAEITYSLNGTETIHSKKRMPRWAQAKTGDTLTLTYRADPRYRILWSADKDLVDVVTSERFKMLRMPASMTRDGNVIARGNCGFVEERRAQSDGRNPAFADMTGEE